MANPKNYAGSFAQGFIDAFLRARQMRMYQSFFNARMQYMNYIMRASTFDPQSQMFFNAKTNKFDSPVYIGPGGKSIEESSGPGAAYERGAEGYKGPTYGEATKPAAGEDPEIRAHIINWSKEHGKDPTEALSMWRAESSGGTNMVGDGRSSFGDFQMHFAGINPKMPHAGLGDKMLEETGYDARDPQNRMRAIDFALSQAAQHGWGDWKTSQEKLGLGDKWNNLAGVQSFQSNNPNVPDTPTNLAPPPHWVANNIPFVPPLDTARSPTPVPTAIPTPGVSGPMASAEPYPGSNEDDMIAMQGMQNMGSGDSGASFMATGGPVPGTVVNFAGSDPLMGSLRQAVLAPQSAISGGTASGASAASAIPANTGSLATASNPMGAMQSLEPSPSQLFGITDPQIASAANASLGMGNFGTGLSNMPGGATPAGTTALGGKAPGYQEGGQVSPSQSNADSLLPQPPNVSSDQSVNDMSAQVQQGTAMLGSATKQEGAMGPNVAQDRMNRTMRAKGLAPATPEQNLIQQSAIGTQINQMRNEIANWPSIFSYGGATANPVSTTSTGYQSGGSVDPDPEQVLNMGTYDEAAGYTPDVTAGVGGPGATPIPQGQGQPASYCCQLWYTPCKYATYIYAHAAITYAPYGWYGWYGAYRRYGAYGR